VSSYCTFSRVVNAPDVTSRTVGAGAAGSPGRNLGARCSVGPLVQNRTKHPRWPTAPIAPCALMSKFGAGRRSGSRWGASKSSSGCSLLKTRKSPRSIKCVPSSAPPPPSASHPHSLLFLASRVISSLPPQTQRTGETEKALRGRSAGTALGLGGGGRLRLRRSDELAGVGSRMTRRTATLLGVQPIEGESLPPWRPKDKEPVVSQRSQIAGTEAFYSGSAEQSRAPTPAPQHSSATFALSASSSSSSSSSSSAMTAVESQADLMTDAAPPNQSAEAAASSESEIRSNGSCGTTVAKRTFSEISPDEADAGAADSANADSASEAEADGDDDDGDDDEDDDDEAEEQPLEELPQVQEQEQEQDQDQDDDFAGDVDASEQQVDETTIASAAFSLGMSDELA
jgi:hypothetical protein